MKLVAEYTNLKNVIHILRDNYGHWFIQVNGIVTQRKLNASEVVRYLANAAQR